MAAPLNSWTYQTIPAATGLGIDKGSLERIFDPFFTTKDRGRGTGLGRASAYGIVKNHDGIVTVTSQPGLGTTFNIYLPISNQEVKRKPQTIDGVVRGSESILLVDDEDMIVEVGKAMLEKLGYRVVVAKDGGKAIDIVYEAQGNIDPIMLDLIMPGMNGGATFDIIRKKDPKIPVLLSSDYSIDGAAREIMGRGCNGFIQKPFKLSEFSR
jgi:two-component system cell cycle sensor histidine kinase/response regulator CckA